MGELGSRWPSFEMVRLDMASGASSAFPWVDVPRDLFGDMYRAHSSLSLKVIQGGREVACFGDVGRIDWACFDLVSTEVFQVSKISDDPPRLINSTLGAFSETVRIVIERFPFYDTEDYDLWDEVADEMSHMMGEIDQASLVVDSFWATFIDDMRMGDLSTEDVLADPDDS